MSARHDRKLERLHTFHTRVSRARTPKADKGALCDTDLVEWEACHNAQINASYIWNNRRRAAVAPTQGHSVSFQFFLGRCRRFGHIWLNQTSAKLSRDPVTNSGNIWTIKIKLKSAEVLDYQKGTYWNDE